MGTLYFGENNLYAAVCDDGFTLIDATVACRQLGFEGAISALSDSPFGPATLPFNLDDVACTGEESSIQECSHAATVDINCFDDEGATSSNAVGFYS